MQSRVLERWEVGGRERERRGDCWDRPRALWVIGGSGARERQSWPVQAGTEGRCICQRQAEPAEGGRSSPELQGLQGSKGGAGRTVQSELAQLCRRQS